MDWLGSGMIPSWGPPLEGRVFRVAWCSGHSRTGAQTATAPGGVETSPQDLVSCELSLNQLGQTSLEITFF